MQEYLIPALLSSIVIRVLIFGASIDEAIGIIALSSLYGFYLYIQSSKEEPINDIIKAEFEVLKQELKTTKDSVSSLKMGQGLIKR